MLVLSILASTFFASLAFTWMLRNYAIKNSLIDIPNHRSSHSIPTPRGGGVAIVIATTISLCCFFFLDFISLREILCFLGAGLLIAVIGFADDHGHIPASFRLIFHFAAAAWGLYWLEGFPVITIFYEPIDIGFLGEIFALLYLVWLLNLYNFMDGIDGIASIEAITVCVGALILHFLTSDTQTWVIIATLLTAVSGFLIWNFPPAKIFMGDAGSGFIGLTLGLLSIHSAFFNPDFFIAWLILLALFIVDSTLTLLRRICSGQKVHEAHRSHAYQYASRLFKSHKLISLSVGAINLCWLLPIALLVALGKYNSFVLLLIAYIPLVLAAIYFKAGATNQKV